MTATIELGLDTFGDVMTGDDRQPLPYAQVIRTVIDQAVLSDGPDVDVFGVNEPLRFRWVRPAGLRMAR